MGADAQAQELRDLTSLAKKLRDYAVQTDDAHYISLFLATAQTLEDRARALAFETPRAQDAPQQPGLGR
ncbi:MAG TPA: hypothetical protein VHC39_02460 [Rhizomicrobium sp.]|nr:hypothetical protein [Rhizomicrobium sp.]